MIDRKRNRSLLTRKEAAQILGLSENTLAKWAVFKNTSPPYFLIGNRARYDADELEEFISSCRPTKGDGEGDL
jgi:excisionase family DNA binding protein